MTGPVPGPPGAGDIVPALLTPGEMVLPRPVAERVRNGVLGASSGGRENHVSVTMNFYGPTNGEDVKRAWREMWEETKTREFGRDRLDGAPVLRAVAGEHRCLQ